ncbi:39S ribosomal protein L51, mitochondrial-like [Argonauta hians]
MLLSLMRNAGQSLSGFLTQPRTITQRICASQYRDLLKTPTPALASHSSPAHQQFAYSTDTTVETNLYPARSKSYKNPRAKRYGYETKYFTGGLLPRIDEPMKSRKPYQVPDNWNQKKALFGQNDYIDILGNGDVHPKDLISGPAWLRGFKGNELQRLVRRLKFEGGRLRYYYPTKHHNIKKRIRYLFNFYNIRRHRTSY